MIIKPEIFEKFDNIICAVSTRVGGVSKELYGMNLSYKVGDNPEDVSVNKELFFKRIGIPIDRVVFQNQIHSTNYKFVYKPGKIEKNDALITDENNLYLAVTIADCCPIFLFFSDVNIVACIHSGWKGTADKITSIVIKAIFNKYKANVKNIFVYIGQCISREYYEVGEEVAILFDDKFKFYRNGKSYIDIRQNNYEQLLSFGIPKKNIEVSDYCTFRDEELFHSYRRDGLKSGRMQGIIGKIK